eukprot:137775-Karenia_brevis.AAC.1
MPSLPDDVVSSDDLLTGSIQSEDVVASAFDPIPGSVPEQLDHAPGTEPNRVQESMQVEQSEHVARSRSLSQPDHMMTH